MKLHQNVKHGHLGGQSCMTSVVPERETTTAKEPVLESLNTFQFRKTITVGLKCAKENGIHVTQKATE